MAITRSQMRRQLYRGGGIASVPRRQRYGIGDLVRKLIPNEIANVAARAAPFVAPFNPLAAGLMRGIGRYDKRGNLGDALKQGLLTTGLGAGARYLGGAENIMGGGITNFSSPFGAAGMDATTKYAASEDANIKKRFLDKFGPVGEFLQKGKDKFDKMGRLEKMGTIFAGGTGLALLADKLVGPKQPDETMEDYIARRKSSVASYLRFYYKRTNPLAGPEEVDNFVASNTQEYAQGGRVGDNMGTGSMGLPGAPRIAPDGIEYDMRENGGFQPLGAKEGKDDVKAVLAKNEFVMTADAVRAAGGGSIQKGAQRMYDTMKRLESRIA